MTPSSKGWSLHGPTTALPWDHRLHRWLGHTRRGCTENELSGGMLQYRTVQLHSFRKTAVRLLPGESRGTRAFCPAAGAEDAHVNHSAKIKFHSATARLCFRGVQICAKA